MKELLSREELFAKYIIDNNATIRKTASVFGYSKSLVHNDVSKKLKFINLSLFNEVKKILKKHFDEKHIRGGIATKKKYSVLNKKNSNKFL